MSQISLDLYLNHLRSAVMLVSGDGTLIFRNASFDGLFGRKAAVSDRVADILGDNPLVVENIDKVRESRGNYFLRDILVNTRGGRRNMDIEVFPVMGAEEGVLAVSVVFCDRSGPGMLEEHEKRMDRLHYLSTMALGLAHEIKNPLSGIKGASQLLAKSLRGKKNLVEYAEIIQKEAVRVDALLNDLLHFTKPRGLKKRPVNVNRILHDLVFLQKSATSKQIVFIEDFDPSLPPVLADPDALSQVFLNLVKNALQAGPSKLSLKSHMVTDFVLKLGDRKKQVVGIDVEDDGAGIAKKDISNIFVPFFTTRHEGLGLGLALCHKIVEEHGGSMEVKSRKGKGTTFSVYLPV